MTVPRNCASHLPTPSKTDHRLPPLLPVIALLLATFLPTHSSPAAREMLILVGTPGEDPYAQQFAAWTANLTTAASRANVNATIIDASTPNPRESLAAKLNALTQPGQDTTDELWIILIGHGTDDGKTANFNLQGDDISQHDFAKLLAPIQRPVVFANLTAASGPFLEALSSPNRTVITATRSGKQRDFAHFGESFTQSLTDPAADLDQDGQTSLLEAFLAASNATTAYYESDQRLPAENALIDDNADHRGTPADAFNGLAPQLASTTSQLPDGNIASHIVLIPSPEEAAIPDNLKNQRTKIEVEIARLKIQKSSLPEDTYYDRLEILLVDLARLYQKIDAAK